MRYVRKGQLKFIMTISMIYIENSEPRTIYEIKRSSEFNTLEFFHIIRQQPFGMRHDIFERAAADVMSNWKIYSVRWVFFLWTFLREC